MEALSGLAATGCSPSGRRGMAAGLGHCIHTREAEGVFSLLALFFCSLRSQPVERWNAAANIQDCFPHPYKPSLETPSKMTSEAFLLNGSKFHQVGNVAATVTDGQSPCSGERGIERTEARGKDNHGGRLK